MPLPKNAQNDKARIDARRAKVATLYLAGKSQQAIACEVGVSQMTVSKDLARLRAAWRESALRDFDAMRGEELARLELIERTAWQAWKNSCRDAETSQVETELRNPGGKASNRNPKVRCSIPVRVTRTRSSRKESGDARFLQQVLQCVELRLKMIDALDPVLVPVPLNNPIINWDEMVGKEIPDTDVEPHKDVAPRRRTIG
ncbi:Uncharacterized protein OS=Idiomarina xiamenensis 10-D-4 GN=A10D4_12889 PE=4 SV=1 [Gemmata massiliana]|uniref:Uncharacterized protein n=1 Tax=Gemmata massiliana TaxID=1210884 RepID=A0A6P2DHZ9_9BACT|nr:helix-turn-helix domain-containing protein [Gemmata massiliana]VTS01621.1 Uncharacterized protein OS=Idiomarina xiamenensis 10-D-4 GN=A10D4_12889 PE=4 SV=1 [Gemmata massiliana]